MSKISIGTHYFVGEGCKNIPVSLTPSPHTPPRKSVPKDIFFEDFAFKAKPCVYFCHNYMLFCRKNMNFMLIYIYQFIREPVKNFLAHFFPLRVFVPNDSVKGGRRVPPNSAFGQKMLISALFDPFF